MSGESVLRNKTNLKWKKMLMELGKDSPVYSILGVDPNTDAKTFADRISQRYSLRSTPMRRAQTHFLWTDFCLLHPSAAGH
jgi:hypothetical protein